MSDDIIEGTESIKSAMVYMIDGTSFETSLQANGLIQHIAYNNPRVVSRQRPDGQGDVHLLVSNINYIEEISTEKN